ncbi:hypothetical protein EMPG_17360 [Blastomyces silverae]|uniref:Uncharacterized protein n=1 Tax=Blastomyces silverae TaxID=2060906 RepID=A0A0H1BD24_9EURO|nr:hypothetical protein EMPG_17360 [Blastomyces silverae]
MRYSFLVLFHLALGFYLASIVGGAMVLDRSVQSKQNRNVNDPGPQLPGDPQGPQPNGPDLVSRSEDKVPRQFEDPQRNEPERRERLARSFSRRQLPPSECKKYSCHNDAECKFLGCTFCNFSKGKLGYCV